MDRILFIVKSLYTMERLGVMQLSALAREQGWETDLAVCETMAPADLSRRVAAWQPRILAFSAMSPEYPYLENLARRLKEEFGLFTVIGGPHATFFQDIIEQPCFDAVAFGEADESFPRFLASFRDGTEYTQTPGLHFRRNETIFRNPPAPLPEILDALPFPDRELLARAHPLLKESRSHIFMAGRGCPNACTYCFNHQFNRMFRGCGQIFRRRSVDHLLAEMAAVRDLHGMRFAYIDDDIFTFCDPAWLKEFARLYPSRVGVPFMINVHANYVDEAQVRLLREAGCEVICFGIECGDQEVSGHLLKRRIPNEKLLALSETLHRHGIRFMTQNILALPVPHPLAVDLRTLDLNIRCRPHYAVAHLFYPLPGTELAGHAEQHGFIPVTPGGLPERTNSYSALQFPDTREKIRVQRLHKLFGLVVSFPWLRPLLPLLLRLPLGAVYALLFVMWYGFSMRFRLEKTGKTRGELMYFLKSLFQSFASFLRRPRQNRSGDDA